MIRWRVGWRLLAVSMFIPLGAPAGAEAQSRSWSLFSSSRSSGSGFGLMPGSYQGFYGNGSSMYGPPVPTYGPVSGTFGASDHRVNQSPPFFSLGWFRSRSSQPSSTPWYSNEANPSYGTQPYTNQPQSNPPIAVPEIPSVPMTPMVAPSTNEPPLADTPQRLPSPPNATVDGTDIMTIEVFLPQAEAQVFIQGNATKQTGLMRLYSSPTVPKGQRYQYEIRAEWEENGAKVVRTRVVNGLPGDRLTADFR